MADERWVSTDQKGRTIDREVSSSIIGALNSCAAPISSTPSKFSTMHAPPMSLPSKLLYDKAEVPDVVTLLNRFHTGAFASPFRSTVPLIALVKDNWPLFSQISVACGSGDEPSVHFEYCVHVPGARGNPSQTDAMLIAGDTAIAIEAKWTEPRYETVAQRLKGRVEKLAREEPPRSTDHERDQTAVVNGWLSLLQRQCGREISIAEMSDVVYQIVHRAASACALSRAPRLAYLHFTPSPLRSSASGTQYLADLKQVYGKLGSPTEFPFFLVELPIEPTPAFSAIQNLPKGAPGTDQKVREAICTTRLFDFGTPHIQRVA